ncbi:hypothetical protein BJ170DRAFT_682249 [Xylariales sp. AK1849]|nr:hypothetical protein BJ170DRAFT_682249 [Xylariales sp. AK1849]
MARWRISGRKQSTSSGENDALSGTVTPDGSEGQELAAKTPSRLIRTLTGGFRSTKPKKSNEDSKDPRLNRPFTQQNLEHQKVLNAFAWNFGERKPSHGGRSSTSGISPGPSRNTSIDSSRSPSQHHGDRREMHPRFSTSFANETPQELSGEESDKEQGGRRTSVLLKA